MSDTAEFTLILNDRVSAAAKNAAANISKVTKSLEDQEKLQKRIERQEQRVAKRLVNQQINEAAKSKFGVSKEQIETKRKAARDAQRAAADQERLEERAHKSKVRRLEASMKREHRLHDQAQRAAERTRKIAEKAAQKLDPSFHKNRLATKIKERAAENQARRALGMSELPSLLKESPSMIGKAFRALGMAGMNTGVLGQIADAAPGIAVLTAGVYGLSKAFDFVAFSVRTVTSGIFELGKSLAVQSFDALNFAQRMQLGFGALLHNKKLGVEVFNEVRKEAQAMSLDIDETAESFRKLLAAQFSVGESMELTKSMADLKAAGSSAVDVQHALLAISQIKMKGKLQAEELTRQLANAGVSSELVYQEIERALGMKAEPGSAEAKNNREKILKMQKGGDISADLAIPAIIRAIARKTGSEHPGDLARAKGAATLEGKATKLKGALRNFFVDTAQIMEKPVEGALQTILGSLIKFSESPVVQDLKENLASIFVATAEFVQARWPEIETILYGVANTASIAFGTISDYIRDNGDTIAEKITAAAKAGLAFGLVMLKVSAVVYTLANGILSLIVVTQSYLNIIAKILKAAAIVADFIPGMGGLAIALNAGAAGVQSVADAGSFVKNIQDQGIFEGDRSAASNSEGRSTDRLASVVDSIPSGPNGGVAGSLKDLLSQGFGKQINVGDVNVKVEATPWSDDPEGAARMMGSVLRMEFGKFLDGA